MMKYNYRILWHRAMILFYFDDPEKQAKHIAELQQYINWATLSEKA